MKKIYQYRLWKALVALITYLFLSVPVSGAEPALIEAIYRDDPNLIQKLIDEGADVNTKAVVPAMTVSLTPQNTRRSLGPKTVTALMVASFMGRTDCVKALLDAGADVNAKTAWDDTALIFAVHHNHKDCVRLLLEAGADPNAKTRALRTTVLMFAAYTGCVETVKALLDAGADATARRRISPETARTIAVRNGHVLCAEILRKAEASSSEGIAYAQSTPVKAADSMAEYERPAVLTGDIAADNPHARKISLSNIKKILKMTADDDKTLLKELASVITAFNRAKQEISSVRTKNDKDREQIKINYRRTQTDFKSARSLSYSGKFNRLEKQQAKDKMEALEDGITQRNKELTKKLAPVVEKAQKLESKLRENGRAADAKILSESIDTLNDAVTDLARPEIE